MKEVDLSEPMSQILGEDTSSKYLMVKRLTGS